MTKPKQHEGFKALAPRIHVTRERIDEAKLTRVDSRACFNCGASGYVGCVHFPKEVQQ